MKTMQTIIIVVVKIQYIFSTIIPQKHITYHSETYYETRVNLFSIISLFVFSERPFFVCVPTVLFSSNNMFKKCIFAVYLNVGFAGWFLWAILQQQLLNQSRRKCNSLIYVCFFTKKWSHKQMNLQKLKIKRQLLLY